MLSDDVQCSDPMIAGTAAGCPLACRCRPTDEVGGAGGADGAVEEPLADCAAAAAAAAAAFAWLAAAIRWQVQANGSEMKVG